MYRPARSAGYSPTACRTLFRLFPRSYFTKWRAHSWGRGSVRRELKKRRSFADRETVISENAGNDSIAWSRRNASHRCLSVRCFAPLPLSACSLLSRLLTREWALRDWSCSAARLTLSFSIGAAGGYSQSGKGGSDSLRAQHVATFAWFLPPLNTCSSTYIGT